MAPGMIDPVRYHDSRVLWVGLGCWTLLAAGGAFLKYSINPWNPVETTVLWGVGIALPFLFLGVYFVAHGVANQVEADEEGITVRKVFRTHRIEWGDIREVGPWADWDPNLSLHFADGSKMRITMMGHARKLERLIAQYRDRFATRGEGG